MNNIFISNPLDEKTKVEDYWTRGGKVISTKATTTSFCSRKRAMNNAFENGLPQELRRNKAWSALELVLAQTLYNQSRNSGDKELQKHNAGIKGVQFPITDNVTGVMHHYTQGCIVISIAELCYLTYGRRNNHKETQELKELLHKLHNTLFRVEVETSDGSKYIISQNIVTTEAIITDKDNYNAETYVLRLCPLFTEEAVRDYIVLPQNIIVRLQEGCKNNRISLSCGIIEVMKSLCRLRTFGPSKIILLDTIVQYANWEKELKKNTSRTLEKVEKMFNVFITIGLLTSFQSIKDTSGAIEKYHLSFNQNFA